MNPQIKCRTINTNTSLKTALTKMDEVGCKLLMIVDENDCFKGLITIGDIQRAIIANQPLEEAVINFCRQDFIVGKTSDTMSYIRRQMLKYRLEYVPIINQHRQVEDIIFWDDIVNEDLEETSQKVQLPVVIMAGGLGTRLRPLTNILPKPLLPYGDNTILENIINRFERYGSTDFYLSVNYKADLIQYYFDNLEEKTYQIQLFSESKPLGTAGSLRLLKDKLNTSFFVSNCDIVVDQNFTTVYNYHKEQANELTMVASLKHYNIPYGTLESGANGELISLKEKPELTFMVNCGVYILEPHLLQEIPEDTFFHITQLIEKVKERKGRVGVFPISEKSWTDIGEWSLYSKILFGSNKG